VTGVPFACYGPHVGLTPGTQAPGWVCPTCQAKGKQYAPSGRCMECEQAIGDPGQGPGFKDQPLYQIGEVSERAGLSLRTVRYYEEAGLVLPLGRTTGGFRLYGDDALERLAVIKYMKPLGFSLEEMRGLLEAQDELQRGDLDPETRVQLQGRLEMFAVAAREKYRLLREQVAIAESFVRRLDETVRRFRD
jgi:MerR family transcriptional regulator, copper efflux regulator